MFSIMEKIWGVFLLLDGVIYDLVDWVYQIFISLARLNLFDDASYNRIVGRIYIVLGVFMLFVLAYSLLKAVINPDEFAKGEASFPNLIKNVVISLIIIAVLPTVFTYAYNIQNAILKQGTIPQLIFGNSNASDIDGGGATMAYWTFRAFFNPDPSVCQKKYGIDTTTFDGLTNCAEKIYANHSALEKIGDWFNLTDIQSLKDFYAMAEEYANNHDSNWWSFTRFTAFSEAVDRGDIRYVFIISTLVGIAMLLILLTYCISLALRAIKLMVFQIIAPIPVICRIMPGDKKKVFDNWVKQIIGTFVDVFLRVAILYLGVFLIQEICEKFGRGGSSLVGLGVFQKLFAIAFLIIGVLMFVRQAPGMLKDLFGFDLGGGTLNPFKIFNEATTAVAPVAGFARGSVMGLSRNLKNTIKNRFGEGSDFKNSTGGRRVWNGFKGALGVARSAVAGTFMAGGYAAYNARNAKNFREIDEATKSGVKRSDDNRDYRDKYQAEHRDTPFGSFGGRVADTGRRIANDLGFGANIDQIKADNDAMTEIENANKAVGDGIKAMIEKAIAKGDYSQSFGTTYTIQQLVDLDQEIKAAEGRGDLNAMRTAQTQRNNLFKLMTDEMKTVAGSGSSNIDRMSNDLKKAYADVFLAANKFRSVTRKFSTKSYVQQAGIDLNYLDDNATIDFANDAQLKSLESNMIDQRRHNNEEINRTIERQQNTKPDNHGGGHH